MMVVWGWNAHVHSLVHSEADFFVFRKGNEFKWYQGHYILSWVDLYSENDVVYFGRCELRCLRNPPTERSHDGEDSMHKYHNSCRAQKLPNYNNLTYYINTMCVCASVCTHALPINAIYIRVLICFVKIFGRNRNLLGVGGRWIFFYNPKNKVGKHETFCSLQIYLR
jgi:hypothetical protein